MGARHPFFSIPDYKTVRKWECIVCGWTYDEAKGLPEEGIAPGTPWEQVPEDFLCPDCGVGKEDFDPLEEEEAPAAEPASAAGEEAQAPVIIIGTGLAGYNTAKEFRKHDSDTPLQLLTVDDGRFYSKPMLSSGFTRNTTADDLATASADEMAEQLKAEVKTFTGVESIDTDGHTLRTDKGETLPYSKLVLAWGAEVIEPPLKGDALDKVYAVNSLLDYHHFRRVLEETGAKKLLLIGAGLIGSEFANDLHNGGFTLEAVEPLAYCLPTLLPEPAGQAVREALEEKGVRYHFGVVADEINRAPEGDGVSARLSDGTMLTADLVVSAIGVRPRIALAEKAGIAVQRGIVVDRCLQTSAPDVYALGDCAEVEGLVLYYVAPLMAAARALGRTLAGELTPVKYPAMPVTIKTPACPVVVSPPSRDAEGEWQFQQDGRNVVAEFRGTDGSLLGFALTGDGTKEKLRLQKELPPLLS